MTKLPVCKAAVALMCSAMLVACGGGSDDDTPADPIDKYVGTWVTCGASGANKWISYTWSFAKVTESTASGTLTGYAYGNANCQGKPVAGEAAPDFTVVMAGTTTASGKTADRFVLTNTKNKVSKYVFFADGNVLYSSLSTGSPLDADGFPTALDLDHPYQKQ